MVELGVVLLTPGLRLICAICGHWKKPFSLMILLVDECEATRARAEVCVHLLNTARTIGDFPYVLFALPGRSQPKWAAY